MSLGSEASPLGAFVCIEGIDGAGKTTLVERLQDYITMEGGDPAVITPSMFPPEAMAIRKLQLDPSLAFSDTTLAMLFTTQRVILADMIRDLRQQHSVVFVDRWVLSTMVYQGQCGTADTSSIMKVHSEMVGLTPDVGIFLDLPPQLAIDRKLAQGGGTDRFESRTLDWYTKLAAAYRQTSDMMGYIRINADQNEAAVFNEALHICKASATFLRAQAACRPLPTRAIPISS